MRAGPARSSGWPGLAIAALGSIATACGSSSISTVAPSGNKCQVSLVSSLQSVPSAGGTGTAAISTTRDCTWTASTSAQWISITDGSTGQGDGSVSFRVAANADPSSRRGTLSVNDASVELTQEAAPCHFTVSASETTVSVSGATVRVSVAASSPACTWTAVSNVPWITIQSGASGSGNGTVTLNVAANTGDNREGAVVVAGETIVLRQPTSACSFSLAPPNAAFSYPGGSGAVTVTMVMGATCAWTATADEPWISITSGAAGTGSGSVTFTVGANAGAARSATMSIAGLPFPVTQEAAPCTYTIAPTGQSVAAAGGSGSFTVTAHAGCPWTATPSAGWITITSGASGNGAGTVAFAVAPNDGGARTGTITAGGQMFTITQPAPCRYSIGPTSQSFSAIGGVGTVTVSAGSGCAWNAVANVPWITVASGAAGAGDGVVTFAVAPNPGTVPRSGTLTIAGQTFTVNEDGAPCLYTLAPQSQTFGATGGTGIVTVTTSDPSCRWDAFSNNPDWLSVTSGSNGTGNGSVSFVVAPNASGTGRTGTLTIAAQTFTVFEASTNPDELATAIPHGPVSLIAEQADGNPLEKIGRRPHLWIPSEFRMRDHPHVALSDMIGHGHEFVVLACDETREHGEAKAGTCGGEERMRAVGFQRNRYSVQDGLEPWRRLQRVKGRGVDEKRISAG